MTVNTLEGFKDIVSKLAKEWAAAEGALTCEFSTNGEMLAEKLKAAHDLAPRGGRVTIQYCETCVKHNPNAPFHVQIEHC